MGKEIVSYREKEDVKKKLVEIAEKNGVKFSQLMCYITESFIAGNFEININKKIIR